MKRLLTIVCCLLLSGSALPNKSPRKDSYRIKTIVIDAGHGGHDTGCLGSSAREKHVALDIALKLGKYLEDKYPDIKVIYTRKTDVFIPLHERANIANKAKADLFICIHLNSGAKVAYGAETYVMGLHKSEDNLNVAKRENAAILLEEDYKTQYDGFDPNSPEANIIFSLYQNQFMHQSLSFASKVQDQFEEYAGRYNRGVKQAGFLVLYKTAMPAVLIECGFLTHDLEENYLSSDKGQSTIAMSIFRAFKEYKIDIESGGGGEDNAASGKAENVPEVEKKTSPAPTASIQPKTEPVKKETDVPAAVEPKTPVATEKPIVAPAPKAKDTVAETPAPKAVTPPVPQPAVAKTEPAPVVDNSVFITVQIAASTNPDKDKEAYTKIAGMKAVRGSDGFTRFIVGKFTNTDEARKKLNQLRQNGFKDAFLSAYDGERKITVPEAEQLLKRR